ncbi:gustatory and pheromone receptor 39a-like [Zophobas morio]
MAFLNHLFLTDILEAVRSEFSTINRELQRVINRTDLNLIFPLTKISKIKQLEENDKTFSILRIEQLSFLHYNLVHQLHQVNKLFDITIIISMMLWFGYVIILTYQFMETVVDGYTLDFAATFYLTTNLLFFYLWLLILIRTFSRTQREANKTSAYVHQIWNQYYRKGRLDEKTRHLQLISIRMLNTKLSFTARNFFSLDETFFHTMLAAIVTYVVILVQFGFSSF